MFTITQLGIMCAAIAGFSLAAMGQQHDAGGQKFFRTIQKDGRWWFVDPHGELFISKGVTSVRYAQDRIGGTGESPYEIANNAKYGNVENWRKAVGPRLMSWGFNTLGSWADEELCKIKVDGRQLACAPTINLGADFVKVSQNNAHAWLKGIFPDVFDPAFETFAHESAKRQCAGRKEDPTILGWFTDNELRWGPDWRGKDELLTMFLALPEKAPGRKAAIDMFRERYQQIEKFNEVWKANFASWDALNAGGAIKPPYVRDAVYSQNAEVERENNLKDRLRAAYVADCEEFLARLSERYFRITAEAIKAADPNHMNFGARFAYVPARPVVVASAKYLDVVSFNCYASDPRKVIESYAVFGKPLIIGEFSFKGKDSGLPNTKGAGPVLATQQDRANAFASYVTHALSNPNLVGYHWFEHADQPKEGRFDGENSNFGVVNIQDEPYEVVVQRMTEINRDAEKLHAAPATHHQAH